MTIFDIFTPQAIAAHWTEVQSNYIDHMGPILFPARKKAGLTLSWLQGTKGEPISLMPSAFDAQATYRDRIGFEKVETEMPFFREAYKLKEIDRQILQSYGELNNQFVTEIVDRMFDDTAELIAGAKVVPERMIMQLLFPENGNMGISIQANGVDYTYNYDASGTWKANNYIALSGTDLWTATTTADPLKAFKTAKDAVRKRSGVTLTTAIMNTNTFNMMGNIDAVKNRWLTINGKTLGYLTEPEIKDVIGGTVGLNIALYDKGYRDNDKVSHQFVPDGYIALVPNGTLGNTWYGTTPEEADLRSMNSNASVAVIDNGVAITQQMIEHPVGVNTFASEIVLPSFERMNEVAVLKVVA